MGTGRRETLGTRLRFDRAALVTNLECYFSFIVMLLSVTTVPFNQLDRKRKYDIQLRNTSIKITIVHYHK